MNTQLKEKFFNIYGEIELLKKTLFKETDFDIDEKNWQNIKTDFKKTRKENFKKIYGKK